MVSMGNSHNTISRRLYLRIIALVQVLVMVMLAVPACCYEVELDHGKASVSQSVKTTDTGHSNCPCCPDESKTDSDTDGCSTCSYCSCYAPLTPVISSTYDPSISLLDAPEQFTKLTDVHLPIFVPPQNIA
jgi:hypothetical protein